MLARLGAADQRREELTKEVAGQGSALLADKAAHAQRALRPLPLATDNTAARNLSYNPEYHERTKHIARRHFYVRELVEDHTLRVPFVRSHDNLADFFTKHLPAKPFFALRKAIMNIL